MALFPFLTPPLGSSVDKYDRARLLEGVRGSMRDCVRGAYDTGLNDGRKWDGVNKPYRGSDYSEEVGAALFSFVRRFASAKDLPGGVPDLTTFDEIAEELDGMEIPVSQNDKTLTLLERVESLSAMLEGSRARTKELEEDANRLSNEFEGDLWRANRRILDRLGFDWSNLDLEGVTADTVEDFIMDAITDLQRKARPAKKPLPASVTGEKA